jgi:hypothetical protein
MTQDEHRGDELVERARQLAAEVHRGQNDKGGMPYIEHPERVAARLPADDHELQAAALLHDVVEDSGTSLDDLRADGFPEELVEIVDRVTKRKGEPYADAVRRAAEHPRARLVKEADVADNSDPARLGKLAPADAERLREKYATAQRILAEAAAEETAEPVPIVEDVLVRPPSEGPASWASFEAEQPELADRVRSRFGANLHHVIGTIRQDGSPRLSGTEVGIDGGAVRVGMIAGSEKLADVRRDPRVELHSAPLEEDLATGDARLSGVLVEGGQAPAGAPSGAFFQLALTRVTLIRVESDRLVITSWTPDRGLRETQRT